MHAVGITTHRTSNYNMFSGFLVNNDVPMYVGFDCDKYFFDGMMDEVRVIYISLSNRPI